MTSTEEWLYLYSSAHALGFIAIRRGRAVGLRPPFHEPGETVYIMAPEKARSFLEQWLAEQGETVGN